LVIVAKNPDEARLIKTAREVNDSKPHWVLKQVKQNLDNIHQQYPDKRRSELTVACLGLAFKPDIDDLRESPALGISTAIAELGAQVNVVEPNIDSLPKQLLKDNVSLMPLSEAISSADIVCVLVRHTGFEGIQNKINERQLVVDAVGIIKD